VFFSCDSNADLLACLLAIDYDAQNLASMTTRQGRSSVTKLVH